MPRFLFCLVLVFIAANGFCQSNDYSNIYFNEIKHELVNQWVSAITQDSNGFMWFATQDGLYKYNGKNFESFRFDPKNPSSLPANWVRSITQDREGNFWLGTQGSGLIKFEENKRSFKQIKSKEDDSFVPLIVYNVFVTSSMDIWVNTDAGLFRKSHLAETFLKIDRRATQIRILELDNKQEIVIFDDDLYYFNPDDHQFQLQLENIPFGRTVVSGNSILYRSEGNLFRYNFNTRSPVHIPAPGNDPVLSMSNLQNGKCILFATNNIYIFDAKTNHFQPYVSNIGNLRALGINEIFLDSQNLLWVATAKGLFKENLLARVFDGKIDLHARRIIIDSANLVIGGASGLFRISKHNKTAPVKISEYDQITSIYKAENGIWAGTYYGHFFFVDDTNLVTEYPLMMDDSKPFKIYGIEEDQGNRLWVSSWEGIYLLDKEGVVLNKYQLNHVGENVKVVKLLIDNDDNLWAITIGNGVYKIPEISKVSTSSSKLNYTQYRNVRGNTRSINANVVMEIHQNDSGELWFGSDYGINQYHKGTDDFSPLALDEEMFDKKVMAIETDQSGLMWISTISEGIFVYDREKEKIFNLKTQDGLLSNACLFTSSDILGNELYFGTDEGIQRINTSNYQYPTITQKPTFKDLTFVGNYESPVALIDVNNPIEIEYNQNNFNIQLEIADYRFPDKVHYYYKLKNSDQYWTKVEDNSIHLNSLKYGDYNLQAKAAYLPSDEAPISSLSFIINPPWHKSILANLVLFLILSTLVIYFFQLRYRQKLASRKLKAVEELDAFKSKLFTNISHELRTPLTLISGPIENQLSKDYLKSEDRDELNLARKNTTRLLNLVNQMLDLSMVDSGERKLNIKQGNLAILLKQIIAIFQYEADKRNIKIVSSMVGLTSAWYDSDCIEKVMSNLLSNAIKYASKGSDITIYAGEQSGNLALSVINVSKKIDRKNMGRLFQRFYQNDASSEGIGVGLALVKELVTLCKGNIIANNIDGNKIQFSVTLPIRESSFTVKVSEKAEQKLDPNEFSEIITNENKTDDVLLIVEDNTEIREFVSSILKKNYTILQAENGEKGVALALEQVPDLIISDVVMPVMDGIQLCNTLKYNELTSHIPIILLTAKMGNTSKIEGLRTGADAYITKPFNIEMLKVRVKKLIESRQQLQKYYSKDFTIDPKIAVSSTEAEFLKRLRDMLDKHVTESNFTSVRFSELMFMSRTQLHRKLKATFGMSATEFIRSQRLMLATKLMEKSDATTSEIAYQVGFNSLSYFSKCFKEVYGCSPSDYIFKK